MIRRSPHLPPPRDNSKPIYDKNLDRLPEEEAAIIRCLREMPESRRKEIMDYVMKEAIDRGIVF